jgi:hypothetical protein
MEIRTGRWAATHEDEIVVFLIGMRINKLWKVGKWLPVLVAMPKLLRWLDRHPQAGLLHHEYVAKSPRSPMVIQYWRSFEDLERFARSSGAPHMAAWEAFDAEIGDSGDVGIWHETYRVRPGMSESIFENMPPTGLGAAGELAPIDARAATAAKRLSGAVGDEPPVVA